MEECETYLVSLLANTEKQAREEGARKYEGGELVLYTGKHCYIRQDEATRCTQEAYKRGADEMLERMIAMVPEEHYGLLGVQIGRVYNAEDKAWNACREAILTSLRSLQSKE